MTHDNPTMLFTIGMFAIVAFSAVFVFARRRWNDAPPVGRVKTVVIPDIPDVAPGDVVRVAGTRLPEMIVESIMHAEIWTPYSGAIGVRCMWFSPQFRLYRANFRWTLLEVLTARGHAREWNPVKVAPPPSPRDE